MELVNLTPHAIVIRTPEGDVTIAPSGQLARLQTTTSDEQVVFGIPMVTTSHWGVRGIPDPTPGKVFVVSSLVAQHARRPDVLAPDTGPTAIRENGQVVAVTRLQRFV